MKADYKIMSAKLYFLLFLSLISLIYLFSPKAAEAKYNIELANSPPYQPSIITSPNINSMLKGGSFLEVNWEPSMDPDRDPITYKLEFAENFIGYNESTIFSTIGEYISDSFFIHQLPCIDSDKAMYRIRAYDGKYYSMWRNSYLFIIDSTPPEVSLTLDTRGKAYIQDTWTSNDVVTFIEARDKYPGSIIKYKIDNGEWLEAASDYAETIIFDAEGEHRLIYKAIDGVGNSTEEEKVNINIDKSSPIIEDIIINICRYTNIVDITVNAHDQIGELAEKAYSYDGGITWETSNTRTIIDYAGKYGEHRLQILVRDKAENLSSKDAAFEIYPELQKNNAPGINITCLTDEKVINRDSLMGGYLHINGMAWDEDGNETIENICARIDENVMSFENGVKYDKNNGIWEACFPQKEITEGRNKTIIAAVYDNESEEGYSMIEDIVIDYTCPLILLKGEASIEIEVGSNYVDEGAIALDNLDGDISDNINIINFVNADVIGEYCVVYNVADTCGNVADEKIRRVNVTKAIIEDDTGNKVEEEDEIEVKSEKSNKIQLQQDIVYPNIDLEPISYSLGDLSSLVQENKNLEINVGDVKWVIPPKAIDINAIANELGAKNDIDNIKISFELTKNDSLYVQNGFLTEPINITANCYYKGQEINLTKFNEYISLIINLPIKIEKPINISGVSIGKENVLYYAPVKLIEENEIFHVKISSLTCGTYGIVRDETWNYKNMEKHWALEQLIEIGSQLNFMWAKGEEFEPDSKISGWEFIDILLSALGLREHFYCGCFEDDLKDSILFKYIDIEDELRRVDAMTIIYDLINRAGAAVEIEGLDKYENLSRFKDIEEVNEDTLNCIEYCISSGLFKGYKDFLNLYETITRAETAIVIKRLLIAKNLI